VSSGAGKYLESLGPVAYYTFDRPDTMEVEGVYYFFNKTAYDFPFITPSQTSFYNTISDYDDPTSYAHSIAEKISRYRSYSTSKSITGNYSDIYYEYEYQGDRYVRKTRNIKLNEYSRPILIPSVNKELIDLIGTEYTVMMQIKIQDMGGVHSLGEVCLEEMIPRYDPETSQPLPPVDFNGFPIDTSIPQVFGIFNRPLKDNYKRIESFRFLDIGFTIEKTINEYITLKFYQEANPNVDIEFVNNIAVSLNKTYSIAFVVTHNIEDRIIIKVYVDNMEDEYTHNVMYPFPQELRNSLKLGFVTGMDTDVLPMGVGQATGYEDYVNGRLRRIYSNRYDLQFDNFAVFNRTLSKSEIRRYHALHYDMKSLYTKSGFTELYDFSEWYDLDATNHIQEDNKLTSIIGDNVNNSLRPSSDDPYNGFTVKRYMDGNIEYSIKFSKKSMLYDMPYFHYYGSDQYRLIKDNTYSLSFFFKTTDMNGLLYSFSKTTSNNKNLLFYFKNGTLQLWYGSEIRKELNGYNNGEFHHILISDSSAYLTIYINGQQVYNISSGAYESTPLKYSVFGNGLPHLVGLSFELALLAYAPKAVSRLVVDDLNSNTLIYESSGIITLNNIGVSTTILIYDHHTGRLLEKLKSSEIDGVFKYTNRYPYTVSVVVNDDAMLNGRSYIVSPVEIE